jgi:hypothetical protein
VSFDGFISCLEGIAIRGTPIVMINSGGSAGSGAYSKSRAPEDAKVAKPAKPDDSASRNKSGS